MGTLSNMGVSGNPPYWIDHFSCYKMFTEQALVTWILLGDRGYQKDLFLEITTWDTQYQCEVASVARTRLLIHSLSQTPSCESCSLQFGITFYANVVQGQRGSHLLEHRLININVKTWEAATGAAACKLVCRVELCDAWQRLSASA